MKNRHIFIFKYIFTTIVKLLNSVILFVDIFIHFIQPVKNILEICALPAALFSL